MKPRKSPFRTLIAVYALVLVAGICEVTLDRGQQSSKATDFSTVMTRLYPNAAETQYLLGQQWEGRARQLIRKIDPSADEQQELERVLREAARHYELAISRGMKSEENLYYNYAAILLRLHDDPKRIEQAVALWRRQFPNSTRPLLDGEEQQAKNPLKLLSPDVSQPSSDER